MRFEPFDPDVGLSPEERDRRLQLLEDEHLERSEGLDPDFEKWLTQIPAEWWK